MAEAASETGPAEAADQLPGFCGLPPHPELDLPAGLDPNRAEAIALLANKWINGTVLHYAFFGPPAPSQRQADIVRRAFRRWKDLGIGLEFREVADPRESELRIRFLPGSSWSYVGNYNTQIRRDEPTMNFGWDLGTAWGWATALHEIGHAIGMPHEHQNPRSTLVWDEEAVIADYMRTQGWTRDKVIYNVVRRIPASEVQGTAWDPHSVMHYPFDARFIKAPPPYDRQGIPRNVELSDQDVAFVRALYPPLVDAPRRLLPMELQRLDVAPGAQADFVIEPDASEKYTISTVGPSDSKMVLFEEREGERRYVTADDDSATERNARIEYKLIRGRRYFLSIRLHHAQSPNGVGVLMV